MAGGSAGFCDYSYRLWDSQRLRHAKLKLKPWMESTRSGIYTTDCSNHPKVSFRSVGIEKHCLHVYVGVQCIYIYIDVCMYVYKYRYVYLCLLDHPIT